MVIKWYRGRFIRTVSPLSISLLVIAALGLNACLDKGGKTKHDMMTGEWEMSFQSSLVQPAYVVVDKKTIIDKKTSAILIIYEWQDQEQIQFTMLTMASQRRFIAKVVVDEARRDMRFVNPFSGEPLLTFRRMGG
jgi:hypothetical protein